jgi:plasmid stabilization system protein ParE
MSQAIWSPEAVQDLEEIALYIAAKDARPATAERIVNEVHQLCDLIATQPEMGERRTDLGTRCRVFSFMRRWIIVYRPMPDGIVVMRFVNGTRDYGKLFST